MKPEMKFDSRFSAGKKITPAQLITELICEKKAIIEGVELPDRFWSNKKWANYFKYQSKYANVLVKQHKLTSLLKALRDKRTKNIFSLKHPSISSTAKYYDSIFVDVKPAEKELEITLDSIGIFTTKKTNLDLLD